MLQSSLASNEALGSGSGPGSIEVMTQGRSKNEDCASHRIAQLSETCTKDETTPGGRGARELCSAFGTHRNGRITRFRSQMVQITNGSDQHAPEQTDHPQDRQLLDFGVLEEKPCAEVGRSRSGVQQQVPCRAETRRHAPRRVDCRGAAERSPIRTQRTDRAKANMITNTSKHGRRS